MTLALERKNPPAIADNNPDVVPICFDIFDTLLTRAVAKPEDVFVLLGRRLWELGLITCSPEVFARQRVYAEERANLCTDGHPKLRAICEELVRSFGLPGDITRSHR